MEFVYTWFEEQVDNKCTGDRNLRRRAMKELKERDKEIVKEFMNIRVWY